MSKTEVQIKVTLDDEVLELILPGMGWTYEEAKLAKLVSDGMTPIQIESGIFEMDPDSWMAVLRVSYARSGIEFPGVTSLGIDLMELTEAVTQAMDEVIKSRPPTVGRRNGSDAPADAPESSTSAAPPSETTTLETGGDPSGALTSDGTPGADSTG